MRTIRRVRRSTAIAAGIRGQRGSHDGGRPPDTTGQRLAAYFDHCFLFGIDPVDDYSIFTDAFEAEVEARVRHLGDLMDRTMGPDYERADDPSLPASRRIIDVGAKP